MTYIRRLPKTSFKDPPLIPLGRLGLGLRRSVLSQKVSPDMYRPLVTPTDHPQFPAQLFLDIGRAVDQVYSPDDGLVDPSPEFPLERPRTDVPDPKYRPSFGGRDEVFTI